MSGGQDGLGQSGFTDWGGGGVSVRSNVSVVVGAEWSDAVRQNLAPPADRGGGSGGLGFSEFHGEIGFSGDYFGGVLDGLGECDDWGGDGCGSDAGFGGGDGGQVLGLSGGNFRGVFHRDGGYQIGDGSDGQIVGQNAESAGISGVRDADLFALRVDVSVAADLVAESVAEVGGGLSGVGVTEAGLTELILRVVLALGVRWVAVNSGEGGRDGSGDWGGGLDGADSSVRVSGVRISSVVSTVSTESVAVAGCEKLGLCGHSQHQKASNL